jgi:glycogen synthase
VPRHMLTCVAGLVPLYLNHKYKPHGVFEEAKALVAIHNLAHQGTALAHEFPLFNLPQSAYNELEWIYEEPDGRRTPVSLIQSSLLIKASVSCPSVEDFTSICMLPVAEDARGVVLLSVSVGACCMQG